MDYAVALPQIVPNAYYMGYTIVRFGYVVGDTSLRFISPKLVSGEEGRIVPGPSCLIRTSVVVSDGVHSWR